MWREFPSGPDRHVPEAGTTVASVNGAFPFVHVRTARSGHARGSTTASRSSTRCSRRRSSGCSAPTGSWSCTRCCWRWRVLPATCSCSAQLAGRGRRVLASGVLPRLGRAGLLRLDDAGAVQPRRWCTLGVLLLALQGSGGPARSPRGTALAVHGHRPTSSPRSARHRDVLEADQRAAVRAPMLLVGGSRRSAGAGGRSGARDRRRCSARRSSAGSFAINLAITGDWNFQGGDAQHVLRARSRSRPPARRLRRRRRPAPPTTC